MNLADYSHRGFTDVKEIIAKSKYLRNIASYLREQSRGGSRDFDRGVLF